MRFEFLTEKDAEKILRFEKKSDYKDGYSEKVLRASLNRENGYYLALSEDDLSAIISFTVSEDFADIEEVLVSPSERKKGYAFSLINKAVEIIKEKGAKKIFLEVRRSNLPAINLYIKAGFNKISERKKYYRDGEDALIFIKEI